MKILDQPFEILARIDLIQLAGFHQREEDRRGQGSSLGVGPVPGFSAYDESQVIPPMSNFALEFTTPGTPATERSSKFIIGRLAGERSCSSAGWLTERARSSQRGCSMPLRA